MYIYMYGGMVWQISRHEYFAFEEKNEIFEKYIHGKKYSMHLNSALSTNELKKDLFYY